MATNEPSSAELRRLVEAVATPEQRAKAQHYRDQLLFVIDTMAARPPGDGDLPAECVQVMTEMMATSKMAFATALTLADAAVRWATAIGKDIAIMAAVSDESAEMAATLLIAVSNDDIAGAQALWATADQQTCCEAVGTLLRVCIEIKRPETNDG